SVGAIVRRSASAARDTARTARRTMVRPVPALRPVPSAVAAVERPKPPIDAEKAFPDLLVEPEPSPFQPRLVDQLERAEPEPALEAAPLLFDPAKSEHAGYELPDAGFLKKSRAVTGQPAKAAERVAETLVQTLANFGIDAIVIGQVAGPRVTRYELQLAPGTKVGKVSALKDDLPYPLA